MSKHASHHDSRPGAAPEFVILPSEDLDALAITLESIVALLPKATIHVVRPGIPAVDAIADLVGGAGLQLVDAGADDGITRMLHRLDRHFGSRRFCWLFAGEVVGREHVATISAGGQVAMTSCFAWLERPSPLAAMRVRAGGEVARSSRCAELAPFMPSPTWRACFLQEVHAAFSSYAEVYEDVCLLTHLGELDAAYQRAELSWTAAEGVDRLRLARAATMIALVTGVSTTSIPACAAWFAAEPEPFAALTYVRVAMGAVPFTLIDRLLGVIPAIGPVTYRGGLVVETYEQVLGLRNFVERERQTATLRRESIIRMLRAGHATAGEVAAAIALSAILGLDLDPIVSSLPAGEQDPLLGDCININMEADFVGKMIAALAARFFGQAWLRQLVQRFVLSRNVDAALSLDVNGVVGFDHWMLLGTAAWVPGEVRSRAMVRAVVHGELDADAAAEHTRELDETERARFASLIEEAVR